MKSTNAFASTFYFFSKLNAIAEKNKKSLKFLEKSWSVVCFDLISGNSYSGTGHPRVKKSAWSGAFSRFPPCGALLSVLQQVKFI
jgi:hypothetical protein